VAIHHGAITVHSLQITVFFGVADISQQLGGLHSNGYISDLFAKAFATEGMKAYVELVQRKERELGTDMLTHQKVISFFFPALEWKNLMAACSGVARTMSIIS
jgi:hypothetical protein